jgi:hypothetical protein
MLELPLYQEIGTNSQQTVQVAPITFPHLLTNSPKLSNLWLYRSQASQHFIMFTPLKTKSCISAAELNAIRSSLSFAKIY